MTGSIENKGFYEFFMFICYKLTGKHLASIEEANQALRKFRRLLEEQKFVERNAQIRVMTVDNFASQQTDLQTLMCSQQMKIEVNDESPGWAYRKNNIIEQACHIHFKKLKLSGRFGKSEFKIRVVDSCCEGTPRESYWPSEDLSSLI